MKVIKKQPDIKNELIAGFPVGSIFRMKSKNTLEQDLVEGNLFMKVTEAENVNLLDDVCQSKIGFVRLGNKFELLRRQGPFMGSIVKEEKISLLGGVSDFELAQCVPGDVVSFDSFPDTKFLIVYDPVDDKGFVTLVKLDEFLKTTSFITKMDKQTPCNKKTVEIYL